MLAMLHTFVILKNDNPYHTSLQGQGTRPRQSSFADSSWIAAGYALAMTFLRYFYTMLP